MDPELLEAEGVGGPMQAAGLALVGILLASTGVPPELASLFDDPPPRPKPKKEPVRKHRARPPRIRM